MARQSKRFIARASRPVRRHAPSARAISTAAIRTVDSAEPNDQSRALVNCCWIRVPIISSRPPPRMSGARNEPKRRHEDEHGASGDAGFRERPNDAAQDHPAAGVEVIGGLDRARIDPLQRGVDRQHHERQVGIDETELHGTFGIEKRDRCGGHVQPHQGLVEKAVVAQDQIPSNRCG